MPKNSRKKEKDQKLHAEIAKQMVTLSSAAFGLVAALAWNSFIQEFFKQHVDKLIPGSGLVAQFAYALLVTVLAVIVTYNLSKIAEKIDK